MNLISIILASHQGAYPIAGRSMQWFVLDAVQALEPAFIVMGDTEIKTQDTPLGLTPISMPDPSNIMDSLRKAQAISEGQADTVLIMKSNMPLIRSQTLCQLVSRHTTDQATMTVLGDRPVRTLVHDGVICVQSGWLWANLPRVGGQMTLPDLMTLATEQGETVTSQPIADPLEAMTTDNRSQVAQAEIEMRRRINDHWMLEGVILVNPAATYIEIEAEIGQDTVVWPNCFIQGQTRIGRGCTIGPNSVIRDSTIGDECRVELSVVEQAIMEKGSDIGPFGHLRKGAHLGPGAHVGNFGEMKNSFLGAGAKMGHFGYLGDATVGEDVNIGAGTITCNYDGQHKHPTTIGEGSFIGSGTMLVAPITIGKGATVGAGSVVTHDVPPDSIAYGVPARVKDKPGIAEPEVE